ncbi:hypothetical protein [Levilactobacillus andaensis]|uniref:hypothetical protein n=1 Tax=Levilactobacillus andaensis TaxID=2799570 RepID=UPI001943D3A3|nr:hypothetical protein [Levilactobacillus andaensis]
MKLKFSKNAIAFSTKKAWLIKIQGTAYKFWIPRSLVYSDEESWELTMYLPDEMKIKLYAGKMKTPSYIVSPHELNDLIENKDLPEKAPKSVWHVPSKIMPVKRSVDDEFKR